MNKKAAGEGTLRKILIAIVLIGIGIFLIYNYILSPWLGQKDIATCGSPLIGHGGCKPICETGETQLKGHGCEDNDDGTPMYCCIDPNYETQDHGGNADYRFDVFDIGLDDKELKGNCVQGQGWTYTCKTGKPLKVKMSVSNTGNFPLDVFANPKVGESYPKQGTPLRIARGDTRTLTVDLSLDAKKSYKIYGAAKCNTGECKTQFGDEGIFKLNDMQYITVIIS